MTCPQEKVWLSVTQLNSIPDSSCVCILEGLQIMNLIIKRCHKMVASILALLPDMPAEADVDRL